jgi:hypothetical protein
MFAGLVGKLLITAYNMETKMKRRSKEAHALQSPLYRQRVRTTKKRPYYDAKEVMDNDFSHEGLTPVGYYIEDTVEDE